MRVVVGTLFAFVAVAALCVAAQQQSLSPETAHEDDAGAGAVDQVAAVSKPPTESSESESEGLVPQATATTTGPNGVGCAGPLCSQFQLKYSDHAMCVHNNKDSRIGAGMAKPGTAEVCFDKCLNDPALKAAGCAFVIVYSGWCHFAAVCTSKGMATADGNVYQYIVSWEVKYSGNALCKRGDNSEETIGKGIERSSSTSLDDCYNYCLKNLASSNCKFVIAYSRWCHFASACHYRGTANSNGVVYQFGRATYPTTTCPPKVNFLPVVAFFMPNLSVQVGGNIESPWRINSFSCFLHYPYNQAFTDVTSLPAFRTNAASPNSQVIQTIKFPKKGTSPHQLYCFAEGSNGLVDPNGCVTTVFVS